MVDGIAIMLSSAPTDARFIMVAPWRARWAWDLDPLSGTLANRREFARYGSHGGAPDGATVDAEGHRGSPCGAAGGWIGSRPTAS
ncbi:MAG: SMP-30/gluconolactonase/LRE family protein [Gammaproteobacteria bacterium]